MSVFYEIGAVEGKDGDRLVVGVDDGKVAVYVGAWLSADGVLLDQEEAEKFAQLFVRACWEAGQQAAEPPPGAAGAEPHQEERGKVA